MTRQIALDLETMSTDSNAAITAIGMCEFDCDTSQPIRRFHAPVHLATSVAAGGVTDPETILWWMGEDLLEARRKMLFNALPIEIALRQANDFMKETGMGMEGNIVWANSPAFDCVILRNAMQRLGIVPFWEFWNERCVRTLKRLYPSIEEPEFVGIKHHAVDDATHEAKVVRNIWQHLHAPA